MDIISHSVIILTKVKVYQIFVNAFEMTSEETKVIRVVKCEIQQCDNNLWWWCGKWYLLGMVEQVVSFSVILEWFLHA